MMKEEGYKLMGAAFEVYNHLGYGMAEEIYQQSMEIELTLRNIPFLSKHQLVAFYKNHPLETYYKPDLLVFDTIVVELKSVNELVAEHEAQLFNYLRIAQRQVGYLLNFGQKVNWGGSDILFLICTNPNLSTTDGEKRNTN